MDTRQKIRLAAALVAVYLLFGRKGLRVKPLSQGDIRWAGQTVGNSSSTYSSIGCVVTAVTMAANALRGTNYTPNDLRPGGNAGLTSSYYDGGAIRSEQAFAKLGCRVTGRVDNGRVSLGVPTMCQIIDTALASGQLALLRVDYDLASPETNHTVVCYSHDGDSYVCVDPAGGRVIKIPGSTLQMQRTADKLYSVTGIQSVAKA